MSIFFYNNRVNLNIININYNKILINYLFSHYKYIIFIKINNLLKFKNLLLRNNIISFHLKKTYLKSVFEISNFKFLKGKDFFNIFTNDLKEFLYIVTLFEKKEFYYTYKNSFSNLITNNQIIEQFNNYNKNYVYIQFFIKLIVIKIILLLILFLFSFIKYIKVK